MTEQQYYTPEIEDIRVGYEYQWSSDNGKNWSYDSTIEQLPNNYEVQECSLYSGKALLSIQEMIDCKLIRTAYLTKEQIEAEGWKLVCQSGDNTYRFTKQSGVEHYHINFSLEVDFKRKYLSISTGTQDYILTKNCKSINEFRTIQKLLQI